MKINIVEETLEQKVKRLVKKSQYFEINENSYRKLIKSIKHFDNTNLKLVEEENNNRLNDREELKIIFLPIKLKYKNEKLKIFIQYDDKLPFYDKNNRIEYEKSSINDNYIRIINFGDMIDSFGSAGIKVILKNMIFSFDVVECGVSVLDKIIKIIKSIKEYVTKKDERKNKNFGERVKDFYDIYAHMGNSFDIKFDLGSGGKVLSDVKDVFMNCKGFLLNN